MEEDSVVHGPAIERQLERHTALATAADAEAAAAAVAADPGQVGQWGPVVNWPVVGVHVALLENGKVLAYDSVGDRATETYPVHDRTRATVWDPATGAHTQVDVQTGYNVFCSGLAHLVDGSVFLAGGNKNAQLHGIRQTHTFNSGSNTWSRGPDMQFERWYPSVTPLRDGEMLITEGGPDTPEVRKTDGTLRTLNTASRDLPLYPWLDVAPDGRAFYSGPDQTMRSLNPAGGGSWQTFGQRDTLNRDYGSRALYDVGKILVSGGAFPASKDARVMNLNGATPQVSATAPMAFGRRQHNLTVLADGSVLATGGLSSSEALVDLDNGVYPAELWNPATGQWKTLAPMEVTRQYHSTALLLPDGRILSSGGGICGACDSDGYLAKNAEVFSPPYLFKKDGSGQLAPRPQITSAPGKVPYNVPFAISTPNAGAIGKVGLVRLGSVTHSVNMEQRYIPLSFNSGSGAVTATSPANENIAPPGVYMLFITGTDGVPSVAKMVQIGGDNHRPTAVATAAPTSGLAPLNVTFSGTQSSDPDPGDSLSYAWDLDDDGGYDDSTSATPSFTYTTSGTRTVGLRVTDQWGASHTDEVTIDVQQNTPPSVSITSPPEGATFASGADITITADASDVDGSVQKVEFFRDGVKLGEDGAAPYSYTWSGAGSGSHTLTARATDNRGAPTTSGPVHITVSPPSNRPPTAVATATPTSGLAPLAVDFDATGSSDPDPGDTLTYAWDLDGDGAYDDSTSATPSFTYTQSGPRTVGLRVTDQQGASDTAEVTITVQNTPPSVNITSPSEGATFATGADIPITAAASDSDGSVQKVEFFRDGVKLGEDQVAPYSYQWSGAASGSHTLTAKATDNRGAPTTSGPVHITVSSAPQPNRPPTAVATGAPTSGVAPLTVSFNGAGSSDPDPGDGLAYAWDLDGDGAFDDSSSAAPSFTYSAAGSYLVRLRVTDEDGASAMAELRIDVGSNSPSPSPITPPSPPPITPPSNPWDLNPPLETDTRDPSVSHFALVPKRFRVASRGTARGSRLRFRLSEPAGVRIVIERARVGRKVDERCMPARRPPSEARSCTRFTRAGVITRRSLPAGQNTITFRGYLGGRALPAARYRATIAATDAAGNGSAARRASFTIVRG